METKEPEMSPPDPADLLAELRAANEDLARRAVAPVWYHPALGLLLGGLIALQGASLPFMGAYYALFSIALVMLVAAYKKHTGLWVNGYRAGRTRVVAIGLGATFTVLALGSIWLQRNAGMTSAPLIGGVIVAVITTVGGFVWEAAFRRDLRDESAL